eukprot:1158480-Pelagomonas_calceolata.AAC.8
MSSAVFLQHSTLCTPSLLQPYSIPPQSSSSAQPCVHHLPHHVSTPSFATSLPTAFWVRPGRDHDPAAVRQKGTGTQSSVCDWFSLEIVALRPRDVRKKGTDFNGAAVDHVQSW